jgi:guanine deaminase
MSAPILRGPADAGSGAADAAAAAAADAVWLADAVRLATENVAAGGGPFGAVIVRDGALVAVGQNRVTRDNDPTAHAEVTAIRAACSALADFSLAGATLYTSCEPCPLCVSAALWARVDRIVFAADRHDAARAGFDDLEFYELFARDRATWSTPVVSLRLEQSAEPFDAWLAEAARTHY